MPESAAFCALIIRLWLLIVITGTSPTASLAATASIAATSSSRAPITTRGTALVLRILVAVRSLMIVPATQRAGVWKQLSLLITAVIPSASTPFATVSSP